MSASISGFRVPRIALAVAGVLLGLAAFSSAAQACSYPDAEQVFSKWGDHNYYELAPDGGFEEGGTGWTFQGGAQLVNGNEDQYLNGGGDEYSLSLPAGGSATSPKVCVDESTPAFRLMALNAGDEKSKLRVVVTYELGHDVDTRNAAIRADSSWDASAPLRLDADGNKERAARITLSPKDDKGAWQVDDLYIDPWARH